MLGASMARQAEIVVRPDHVVQPRFAGVGFHVSFHLNNPSREHLDQVIAKRWRELNPSFARVGYLLRDGRAGLDALADRLSCLKATGTEIYLVTWDPEDVEEGAPREAYARRIADDLEYLVRERGLGNVRYYCMTNELTLHKWADMVPDLPRFADYHRALHREFRARDLPVGLLASDASPIENWPTVGWAAANMDDVTEIYGGHHYFNEHEPDDPAFYPWFLGHLKWGVGVARNKGKDFILGEFGCRQDHGTRDGQRMDNCVHFGRPAETMVGMQLAEAAIAALNAGVHALGNWTFTDYPDSYRADYTNRWGTFEWEGDRRTRAHYYAYGLLTRFFRGPSEALAVETDDPLVRAGAVRHPDGSCSVAVVNRGSGETPLSLRLGEGAAGAVVRKYVYDPANVPQHPLGDLQPHEAALRMADGVLSDSIRPGTLAVYTTAYTDAVPAAVKGVTVERVEGGILVQWQASPEPDLCYYRVYRSPDPGFTPGPATRIGSTVATSFNDGSLAAPSSHYKVVAVSRSGNAGTV
jgi:hypothetical protein